MTTKISWGRSLSAAFLVVFLAALGAALGATVLSFFKAAVLGAVGGGLIGVMVAVCSIRWVLADNGDLLHYARE